MTVGGVDLPAGIGEIGEAFPYGLGFGIGLLVIRFLSLVIQQWNVKEDRLDKGTKTLIEQQQQQIASLLEWKDDVEVALKECQQRHAASELEVARLSGLLAGFGDARQQAALIVAAEKAEGKLAPVKVTRRDKP